MANQSGIQSAIKAASNPASSSYGKYPSLSTLQSKYGASSSKRKSVVNAFKSYGITAKVDVTHLRVSATVSVGKAQKMFGTKWKVYKTSSGSKVAMPVDTPKLPSGIKGNVDTVAGMRTQLSGGSSSAARAAVVADGGTPTRTGTPAFGCVPQTFPAALALRQRPVPEPDPDRLRDRAAAGRRPAGPGLPAGDRRRGADAGLRREHVPLVLRDAGHGAEDPQRRLDQADPRELARRHDGLDGRAEALRFDLWVHPISESDDDGDVARLPARCSPSRCRPRPTAPRCHT